MRYRALDAEGDYQFGGASRFLVDSPDTVAQAILTRLRLKTNEWFLDTTVGTPYDELILGYGTQGSRDVALRQRILGTQGVRSLLSYGSSVDANRRFTVTARVDTIYGPIQITEAL
jgi:hypothetical protein